MKLHFFKQYFPHLELTTVIKSEVTPGRRSHYKASEIQVEINQTGADVRLLFLTCKYAEKITFFHFLMKCKNPNYSGLRVVLSLIKHVGKLPQNIKH